MLEGPARLRLGLGRETWYVLGVEQRRGAIYAPRLQRHVATFVTFYEDPQDFCLSVSRTDSREVGRFCAHSFLHTAARASLQGKKTAYDQRPACVGLDPLHVGRSSLYACPR